MRNDAVKAYLKAAEIAERDGLVGTATVADRIARAYYYTMLKALDPDRVSEAFARQVLKELDQLSARSEEHTSELQSLMRVSYAVFCLKKKNINRKNKKTTDNT